VPFAFITTLAVGDSDAASQRQQQFSRPNFSSRWP
jgi:hypothetical protein